MVHLRVIESPVSHPESIVEAFRSIATPAADSVAVRSRELSLTYRELERESDALAVDLLKEGGNPGEPVGVICERSPRLIVALPVILKAGGACLRKIRHPLDRRVKRNHRNRAVTQRRRADSPPSGLTEYGAIRERGRLTILRF